MHGQECPTYEHAVICIEELEERMPWAFDATDDAVHLCRQGRPPVVCPSDPEGAACLTKKNFLIVAGWATVPIPGPARKESPLLPLRQPPLHLQTFLLHLLHVRPATTTDLVLQPGPVVKVDVVGSFGD